MRPSPYDDHPSPLRVLHVSGRSDPGGGPEHILQIVSANQPGIFHFVACPPDGIYWSRYATALSPERLCPLPHRRFSFSAFRQLLAFARAQGIQVIHSHGTCAGLYGRLLSLWSGLPVVHTFHGIPLARSAKQFAQGVAEHLLSRLTTFGIAVSHGEGELVRTRWPGYARRLAVVPNGIDLDSEPELWAAWPPRGTLRIVSFTRCNDQKHPDLLISIAQLLQATGLDFTIDAYGEGFPDAGMSADVSRLELDSRLHFMPSTATPLRAFGGAHLYLSTSRWEGMPLALIEAWRAGLLVVATDVIGNRDLVQHGMTGFLYPCSDSRSAARMIHALVTQPDAIDAVRQRAERKASVDHNRDRMVARLTAIYRKALAHEPTPDDSSAG